MACARVHLSRKTADTHNTTTNTCRANILLCDSFLIRLYGCVCAYSLLFLLHLLIFVVCRIFPWSSFLPEKHLINESNWLVLLLCHINIVFDCLVHLTLLMTWREEEEEKKANEARQREQQQKQNTKIDHKKSCAFHFAHTKTTAQLSQMHIFIW